MTKNAKMACFAAVVVVALGAVAYSANATSSSSNKGFANFESADKNGDGTLDRAEFAAFLKSHHATAAKGEGHCAKGGSGHCAKGGAGGCSGGEGHCSGGAGGCGGHGHAEPAVEAPVVEAAANDVPAATEAPANE